MSSFILIDLDAVSFLVCALFVAASLFAMQILYQDSPYYSWWGAAFAIGGLRYFITYLVSVAGLQMTVFILDLLFIAQALLMLQGTLLVREQQQPVWLMLLIGLGLAAWGYIASSLSFSWALHDIPLLGFYAGVFLFSGAVCITSGNQSDVPPGIRYAGSGAVMLFGLIFLLILILKPDAKPHWLFTAEQVLLVGLGVMLVFAILSKLQNELHKTSERDPVSGAYTRHYFFKRLNEELKRAQRYERPFSLALLRIDGFASLTAGLDKKLIASMLRMQHDNIRQKLRDVDFTGLTEPGEFAIALPETDITEARHVIERQLEQSKTLDIPGLDLTQPPTVYLTVVTYDAKDKPESIYLRAKNIIDDRIDGGMYPLLCQNISLE